METPTPSERGDASLLPRPLSIAEIVSPDDQPIVNPSLRRAGTRTSLSLAQLTRGATAAKQRLPVARAFADEVVTYILSQQWYDLVFVHIFRLRPTPYCCPASKSPEEEVLLQMVLEQCTAAEEHAATGTGGVVTRRPQGIKQHADVVLRLVHGHRLQRPYPAARPRPPSGRRGRA